MHGSGGGREGCDRLLAGRVSDPPLLLVPFDNCIWKVVQVQTWDGKKMRIDEFESPFGVIDVQTFGMAWVCGPPFSFRAGTEWVAPWNCAPLNAMEVLALAACDDFPMEKALRLR